MQIDTQQHRVFNTETVLRIGLQNRVMRKLRQLGCKVKQASLDPCLTIAVEPSDTLRMRRQPGGHSMRNTEEGRLVCIDVDGCRVIWLETNPS